MLPNNNERPAKCPLCNATFSTEIELQVHLFSATFGVSIGQNPVPKCPGRRPFIDDKECPRCTQRFPTQYELENHIVLYGPLHDDNTRAAATLAEIWYRHRLPNQDLIDSIGHLDMFHHIGAPLLERVLIVIKNRRRAAQVVHKMVDDWGDDVTRNFILEKIRLYPFRDQLPVQRSFERPRQVEAGPSGSSSVTQPSGTAANRKVTPISVQAPPPPPPPYQRREGSPIIEGDMSASVLAPTSTSQQAEGREHLSPQQVTTSPDRPDRAATSAGTSSLIQSERSAFRRYQPPQNPREPGPAPSTAQRGSSSPPETKRSRM